jgi:hypothetical protein
MSTLALCPSRGRPEGAARALASFLETRHDPGSRLLFIVDADDPTGTDYPPDYTLIVPPSGCMGGALKAAATDQNVLGQATSVGMIGDDNLFVTPGWDVTFDGWLTANIGIAYGDDGFQHEKLPTSWWVSRPLVDVFGMAEPGLRHFYMDNYWLELGQATRCLRYFGDVSIEHLHPLAHKAPRDAIYDRSYAFVPDDQSYFRHWQQTKKQLDVDRLRNIIDHARPVRVFADWHHPALWESLEILFSDHYGWELYSPIGLDWLKHGWSFDFPAGGWGQDRYLVFPDAVSVNGHFEVCPPEYPDRPRKLVTWEQAQLLGWDYVIASVSVHQQAFAMLAAQWRAKFIHQVGNARHAVNPSIPATILASSRAVQPARNVSIYHQEFDRDLFAPGDPRNRSAVAAFMLRLDTTSCDYSWMAKAAGRGWHAYGGLVPGDPAYLAPMSKVAEAMRAVGWIWHDKKIGDGYGHVVWTAAYMGRPLIGHASHYKGQLAEPLWRDLETCIDLDRHSPRDALRLWKAISADPEWYDDMSARMRETFAANVDFDHEAAYIRRLLERA